MFGVMDAFQECIFFISQATNSSVTVFNTAQIHFSFLFGSHYWRMHEGGNLYRVEPGKRNNSIDYNYSCAGNDVYGK
ncbi:hypothetical protein MAR_005065 [Mya arenaria]|uniref:Uncharacterized protein n=1 Tax=Mya arenaria TaxID=6604 RepID=A0ABY7EYE3_MYAAR|nr:hypothetical protein MAR_005065 [Mya arenaria]